MEQDPTYIARLYDECEQIDTRIEKLSKFITSPDFVKKVPNQYSRFLLKLQYEIMLRYSQTVTARGILADALEKGEQVRPICPMSFGMAIEALKNGFAIRRDGWNGKDIFVFKQVPSTVHSDIIPKMVSLSAQAKRLILNSTATISYTSQCIIFNAKTGRADSWVPSISDTFAEDWQIVL